MQTISFHLNVYLLYFFFFTLTSFCQITPHSGFYKYVAAETRGQRDGRDERDERMKGWKRQRDGRDEKSKRMEERTGRTDEGTVGKNGAKGWKGMGRDGKLYLAFHLSLHREGYYY